MRYRYSKWTSESMTDEQRLESLASLFSYLLLQTSGDVNEALEWLRQLAEEYGLLNENLTMEELIDKLKEMGIIEEINEEFSLTTKGIQKIRQDALKEIFNSLRKGSVGYHEMPQTGTGVERVSETKKWTPGEAPTNIDLTTTLTNAFKRDGIEDFTLKEEDLEVYETEHMTSCATVLMLDISHSMILYGEDRITPAKQVALALSELIMQKYPKDYLALVVFGDDAKLVSLAELPFLTVGPYHTNTRAGLQLARNLLRRRRSVNKQIFMVTDGKPSAIFDDSGRLYKNSFGLDPRIVNKTLDEAVACRREKVAISTFMVARDPYLVNFVEELTKANRGRAYYSQLQNLGEFIFVDYIRNRRKKFGAM
ncbi:MAG: VWA domain-containing protein [Ignavibacteriae bacterium]|nr:VWA domain-containing protein [Ignavibacteria bacterium]MBI3364885.1 VWA domain-containing protein [Ignavibacteriota bacterium]